MKTCNTTENFVTLGIYYYALGTITRYTRGSICLRFYNQCYNLIFLKILTASFVVYKVK